jgi:hypothetical protein
LGDNLIILTGNSWKIPTIFKLEFDFSRATVFESEKMSEEIKAVEIFESSFK